MKKKIFKEKKYKNLLNIREFPPQTNLRILKFKRPKWNFLKKSLQRQANKIFFFKKFKKMNKKLYFYNQKGYIISSRWSNIRFRYKELLLAKRRLYLFFSLKSKLKPLKKNITNQTSIKFLNKLETRLDILLWRIGIFSSPAVSRFYLNHKFVKLNGKNININAVFLQKGDIISFTDLIKKKSKMEMLQLKTIQNYNKKFLIFQEKFNSFLPYFIEVNWDTLEIICLKNATDLDINHMLHMYPKNLNISQLKNYLRLL